MKSNFSLSLYKLKINNQKIMIHISVIFTLANMIFLCFVVVVVVVVSSVYL